ncbi:FecR family protein [Pelomonas sp. BJYL3]|uniref:FecR family protein n=1 Tax=Pelomonas sp. BJYL3 TaxID=2976697 RepID=UPI0022B3CC51|nr:FecR family protein [Pelomonas sp. BJYL3]
MRLVPVFLWTSMPGAPAPRAARAALALLALLGWAGPAAATEPSLAACEVRSLKGSAQWQQGTRQGAVQAGLAVPVGMELRTAKGARLKLHCADDSVLVMAEQSRLLVEHFEAVAGQPRMASFLLKLGLLGQKVAPVAGGHWQVRTPSAVTAVRGTEFLVEVDGRQATQVHVLSGEVAVESREPPDGSAAASEPFSSKGVQAQWRGEAGPGIVLQPGQGGVRCQQGHSCAQGRRDEAALQRLQQRLALD